MCVFLCVCVQIGSLLDEIVHNRDQGRQRKGMGEEL
jgi:hypothetical protein